MSHIADGAHDDAAVLNVLVRAWDAGCPVAKPSPEFSRAAVRRYRSSANRGVGLADRPARLRDLAKGLVAYHDGTPSSVGPLMRDYEYLADLILAALDSNR